jgi:DNA-binding response OmpR family regulator
MPDQDTPPKVLVVDDEAEVANVYASVLEEEYAVRTAHSGEEALEQLEFEPDVVLLDRRMPDMSGEEVLERMQAHTIDSRVAMVTAVEPDFDVIEMPFDDYLVKPVDTAELRGTVEELLLLDRLHEKQVELGSKQVTRNVLEVEKTDDELASSEEYAELLARIEALEREIDSILTRIGDHHPEEALTV